MAEIVGKQTDTPETFDIKKLLSSPFTGLYWTKVIMFSLGAIVLFFIVMAVWKTYFKKPDPVQNTQITAQQGSNVKVVNVSKPSRFMIPFIEGYVEQRSSADLATAIRAGLRFEF